MLQVFTIKRNTTVVCIANAAASAGYILQWNPVMRRVEMISSE